MEMVSVKVIEVVLTGMNLYIMFSMRKIQVDRRLIDQLKDENRDLKDIIDSRSDQEELHKQEIKHLREQVSTYQSLLGTQHSDIAKNN